MAVYRVYVEKKSPFDVEAQGVLSELRSLLGIEMCIRDSLHDALEAVARRVVAVYEHGEAHVFHCHLITSFKDLRAGALIQGYFTTPGRISQVRGPRRVKSA